MVNTITNFIIKEHHVYVKECLFPQYAKAGSVDILTKYSIGNKSYNVYLITIDDDISVLQNNASDGEIKFSKQPNIQNKKVNNGEQPREKFIINTPLGYVADVDGFVVAFTEDKHEAQAFDNQEKAIKLGKNIFQNQLLFRVETLNSFKKEYNNHKCHCSNEGDFIVGLLNQIFSGVHPNEVNMEKLKEFFPDAEIKGFVIDENGHVEEL